MKFLPITLFSITFLLISSLDVSDVIADYSDFIISEIMYDPPGADKDHEWIEVFHNATTSATILGGSASNSLRFFDGTNHTFSSPAFQGSLTVGPQSYFVLAQDGANFKLIYPDYAGTVVEVPAMNLGNTQETIGFKVGSSGSLFSAVSYQKSWGGSANGRTLEKKVLNQSNESANWVESAVDKGTPGLPYTEPPPATYPTKIRINEFMPNPELGSEWVELYNFSETETAVLNNWQIDDIEGGSAPQTFSQTLGPQEFAVVYLTANKLNNNGDTVRLIRPDAFVADSFNYSSSIVGVAYAFDGSTFVQTKTATPGQANQLLPLRPKHKDKIVELKRLPFGSAVELTAFVTSPAGLFGEKELYVSDQEAGIRIVYTENPSFKIETDDLVKVSSSIEQSRDEAYIKTDLVELLQKGARHIEERKILTGEAREPFEGMLVKIVGKMVEGSGETFYLDDGSGRTKIYLRDSTGIIKPSLARGDNVAVIGILSQYGFLKNGEANYRILPRFQSDIVNLTSSTKTTPGILGAQTKVTELPETGAADGYNLGWTLIFLGLSLRLRGKSLCHAG